MKGLMAADLIKISFVIILFFAIFAVAWYIFFGGEGTFFYGFREAIADRIRNFIGMG